MKTKNENTLSPYGICKCGLCFDVEYPPEFGKNIIAVCKKCHTIVKDEGAFTIPYDTPQTKKDKIAVKEAVMRLKEKINERIEYLKHPLKNNVIVSRKELIDNCIWELENYGLDKIDEVFGKELAE